MDEAHARSLDALKEQLGKVILGKPEVIRDLLIALLSRRPRPDGGRARAWARRRWPRRWRARSPRDFKRVQFTPDLLPTDILGSSVYNPRDGSFTFKAGPDLHQRPARRRDQPRLAAHAVGLLEAMSERQVSIEGTTHPLPAPFLVIATQNPVEFHGTYPLPEAQLDRFGMRINLGYPRQEHEVDVLFSQFHHHPARRREADPRRAPAVLALQAAVRAVRVERTLGRYLVDLADATPAARLAEDGLLAARDAVPLPRRPGARLPGGPRLRDPRGREGRGRARARPSPRRSTPRRSTRASSKEDVVREVLDRSPWASESRLWRRALPLRARVVGPLVRSTRSASPRRGRYLLWAAPVFARARPRHPARRRCYVLFAVAAAPLLAGSLCLRLRRRPRARF